MSNKHLKKGDPRPPPMEKGKLRLYSMLYCPYAQRVRLVLQAKGAAFEVVNIHLGEKPEWIVELHPQGKVPALEVGGERVLVESVDISDYLDGLIPEPRLWPADAPTKDRHQKLINDFSKVSSAFHPLMFGQDKQEIKKQLELLEDALQPYEDELARAGTTFFGGQRPGMLDYMMWPWGERYGVPCGVHDNLDFPTKKFPKLVAWRKAMKNDASVKAQAVPVEKYINFLLDIKKGVLDFDNVSDQLETTLSTCSR